MKDTDNRLLPIFRGWTLANFPFIEEDFDELTLYGMICKITEYLNKMREQVNKNTETAIQYEQYLTEIQAKVNELEEDYNKFKDDIEEDIDNRFRELTAMLTNEINNQLAIMRYYIDTRYQELDNKINQIIEGDIEVYDPTTGLLSPIQVVIDNLFDMNRVDAITCTEFDGLELTATEYDSKDISAYNFDVSGKTLLIPSI